MFLFDSVFIETESQSFVPIHDQGANTLVAVQVQLLPFLVSSEH